MGREGGMLFIHRDFMLPSHSGYQLFSFSSALAMPRTRPRPPLNTEGKAFLGL